jgi:hypothetical protein
MKICLKKNYNHYYNNEIDKHLTLLHKDQNVLNKDYIKQQ